MAALEERVSKLEGGQTHLATKADIAELKADLIKWGIGAQVAGILAVAALIRILA